MEDINRQLDEMDRQILHLLAIPPIHMGKPANDGNWTTLYADQLDQLGLRAQARAERCRALRLYTSEQAKSVR